MGEFYQNTGTAEGDWSGHDSACYNLAMLRFAFILLALSFTHAAHACEMDAAYGGHDAYVRWLAQQINSRDKASSGGATAPTRTGSAATTNSNLDDNFFRSSAPEPSSGGRSSGGRYQAE